MAGIRRPPNLSSPARPSPLSLESDQMIYTTAVNVKKALKSNGGQVGIHRIGTDTETVVTDGHIMIRASALSPDVRAKLAMTSSEAIAGLIGVTAREDR